MKYKIVSIDNVKENGFLKVSVEYIDGVVIHKCDHFMQIYPTSVRATKFDEEGDVTKTETFDVDIKAVVIENIEKYMKGHPDLTKQPFDYRDPTVVTDTQDPTGLIASTTTLVGKETPWQP